MACLMAELKVEWMAVKMVDSMAALKELPRVALRAAL